MIDNNKAFRFKKVTCDNCTNKISLSRYKNQEGLCNICTEFILNV